MTKKMILIPLIVIVVLALALSIPYLILGAGKSELNDAIRSTLPGSFIELPQGVVHYDSRGNEHAQPIFLVHGFSAPYYVWDKTIDALSRAGFRVIRFDLFGRGYSDRPDIPNDIGLFTSQLSSMIAALKIDKQVDLVGLSLGGPIVARFANENRGLVRRLCLIDPVVSKVTSGQTFPLGLPLAGEYFMSVVMAPFFLPEMQTIDLYEPEYFPEWKTLYREQIKYLGFERSILSTIRHLSEIDAIAEYSAIEQKRILTLLLWGEYDREVSKAEIESARKVMPSVRYHEIERAGHVSQYERPDLVNPILIDFFKAD
jgi:pimeloyl-ACP methyl ester carboxylesterase